MYDPAGRDRKFGDRINPLDVYNGLGLFQCFWSPRRDLLEVMVTLMMICGTSHRQRGVPMVLLVVGAVLASYTVLLFLFLFSLTFFLLFSFKILLYRVLVWTF